MYRFSRAIFVEIKDLVDPHPETITAPEAKRYVLHCCEATIERLARDPRYFAKPSQSLFSEVRHLFSISDQARVYRSIERHISQAIEYIMEELERAGEGTAQRAGRRRARASPASARRCPTASTAPRTSISRSAARP